MSQKCPRCEERAEDSPKYGYFVRISDSKKLKRFKCRGCGFIYSQATFQDCYRQKKRRLNPRINELFCSGVSQRRIAILLKINRKTVARKLIFLAKMARQKNLKDFNNLPFIENIQFDDMETIEHTKCKPLSITLAVEKERRFILGFRVSQMPAKGHLAKISYKKYGFRKDLRSRGRRDLFKHLKPKIAAQALIESDENPHYKPDVKEFFPQAIHKSHLGERGSVTGQGELKKVRFDPLFSLNHTCAMFRANVNRLFRKTWCTTKLPERLSDHLDLYVCYHNQVLIQRAA